MPYSISSSRDNKFITKKILCHKLKKQYQHKCQKLKQDIAKRIELLKLISKEKNSNTVSQKDTKDLEKTFKNKFIQNKVKCRSVSKKLPYLSINEYIPKLDLEEINENELEIEDNRKIENNKLYVLSFPKKTVNYDLSKRPMLTLLKKMNQKKRENI